MASKDAYLARVNRGIRDVGYAVSLEVSPSGRRVRLRATLPSPDGRWKQPRITTPLEFPGDLERARRLAEELGRDVELHRRGLEPFPEQRWLSVASGHGADTGETTSGIEALRRTELWWSQQRNRGISATVSWATDYAAPLKPLLDQNAVDLRVLRALVMSKAVVSGSGMSPRHGQRARIKWLRCFLAKILSQEALGSTLALTSVAARRAALQTNAFRFST